MTWAWRVRIGIVLALLVLLAVTFWKGYRAGHTNGTASNGPNVSAVLSPQDEAKLTVDPVHHTIILAKRNSRGVVETQTKFLPDRKSEVVLEKDGTINVKTKSFGTETAPFFGLGIGKHVRGLLGVNLFYVDRCELGTGVSSDLHSLLGTNVFASVQYNVYSNTSVGVAVDLRKDVYGLISWKF